MSFVVLDTETTGRSYFKGDRLIEIGACKYVNRVMVSEYHQYINPQCAVSHGALKVHGLSDQFLQDKPLFSDVADEFVDFISGSALVIHNAPFDLGFLDNELSELGMEKLSGIYEVIDTLPMARKMYPGQRNSLDALCKRLGVDNQMRLKHGALLDAKLLAEVYLIITARQNSITIGAEHVSKTIVKKITSENYLKKASTEEISAHREFLRQFLAEEECW